MAQQLSKYCKSVMKIFLRSSMVVYNVPVNMEFNNTPDNLMETFVVNTSVAKEHVA